MNHTPTRAPAGTQAPEADSTNECRNKPQNKPLDRTLNRDYRNRLSGLGQNFKVGVKNRADALGEAIAIEPHRLPIMLLAAFCLTSVFAVSMMLSVGADVALAQDGSQIQGAITSVRNWLAGLIVALGGVALLVAIIIFLFSGSESRRRAESARYIGAICVAIAAGLMVPAIIGLIQGFAGGGGG